MLLFDTIKFPHSYKKIKNYLSCYTHTHAIITPKMQCDLEKRILFS